MFLQIDRICSIIGRKSFWGTKYHPWGKNPTTVETKKAVQKLIEGFVKRHTQSTLQRANPQEKHWTDTVDVNYITYNTNLGAKQSNCSDIFRCWSKWLDCLRKTKLWSTRIKCSGEIDTLKSFATGRTVNHFLLFMSRHQNCYLIRVAWNRVIRLCHYVLQSLYYLFTGSPVQVHYIYCLILAMANTSVLV